MSLGAFPAARDTPERSMPLPRIYFEKLLENSPDIVVAVDRRGSIVFYNDGARQTLGYTSDEMLGKPVSLLYPSLETAREVMRAMRGSELGPSGTVKNCETVFVAKDGARIPVAISGSITFDEDGIESRNRAVFTPVSGALQKLGERREY